MKPRNNLSSTFVRLRAEYDNCTEAPQSNATELPLSEIKRAVSVFQPRALDGNLAADESHLAELVRSIEIARDHLLDPIAVWWSGKAYYCIDGHHRLEAYKRHCEKHGQKAGSKLIPVKQFIGSLDDAMGFSGLANRKDRLPMRKADKSNYAWRLTCSTALSARRVSHCTGVSERQVFLMRKALETLLKLANDHALDSKKPEFAGPPEALTACQIEALKMRYGEMSWAEAKATAEGEVNRPGTTGGHLV